MRKTLIILGFLGFYVFSQNKPVVVTRDLPDNYIPGSEIEVKLKIDVDENNKPNALIISEKPPENWLIKESNPPYNTSSNGEYKYLFYPSENIVDKTIIYKISVPFDSSGEKEFYGQVKYITQTETKVDDIGGDTTITILQNPVFYIDKDKLIFVNNDSLKINLKNLGGRGLNWYAEENINWLYLSKYNGIISPGMSEEIEVKVDRKGLSSGTYIGSINFKSDGGDKVSNVILVVNKPSSISSFNAIGIPGGVYLCWENPLNFTGTIIFKKIGRDIEKEPVDGIYYGILGNPEGYKSSLLDGSICIFKDESGKNEFIDETNTESEVFYKIYSYVEAYYSEPLSAKSTPLKPIFNVSIENNNGKEFSISNTNTNFDGTYFNIPPNSLVLDPNNPAKISYGIISPSEAPIHPGLLGFANIYSFRTDNFNLKKNNYIEIKMPAYNLDISASGVEKLEDIKVYYWNENNKKWKEAEIIEYINEPDIKKRIVGYVDFKINDIGKINYISTGYPLIPPSEGGGGCFIATACFGSPLAKEVEILREFRDRFLIKNKIGNAFVRWYYRHSPRYAEIIKRKPFLKKFVRITLRPIIWFAKFSIKFFS
jgi:hypothetical protein